MFGFNRGDCTSYYLSLINSITIYSFSKSSESTIYDINQLIEQYVSNLNDNFDVNTSAKDNEYQYYAWIYGLCNN